MKYFKTSDEYESFFRAARANPESMFTDAIKAMPAEEQIRYANRIYFISDTFISELINDDIGDDVDDAVYAVMHADDDASTSTFCGNIDDY